MPLPSTARAMRLALAVACVPFALAPAAAHAASSVYVTNSGANDSQYDVGPGGALAPKSSPTVATGTNTIGIALSPDGKSAYITRLTGNAVLEYDIGAGGALAPKASASIVAGTGPRGLAISPDGKSVYVANLSSANISQYDVGAGGVLAAKTPATIGGTSAAIALAVSPDGKSLYAANEGNEAVTEYDIGAGGLLAPKPVAAVTAPAGSTPESLVVSPDGKSVYVVEMASSKVAQYDVGAGGQLVAKPTVRIAAGTFPSGIAISPDGNSVYVTATNNVLEYDVGAGGALAPKATASIPAGTGPQAIVVSPDGRSAYVPNGGSANVSQYDIGAGGALSAKTTATIAAGTGPLAVAISPDQGPLAAFTTSSALAGVPVTFDGSGSSDPDGTVVRFDWNFGDGTSAANVGAAPTHVYAAAGTFTATLTVTDDAGCSGALVFTGQTASCAGSPGASTTRTVSVAPGPKDAAPPGALPKKAAVRCVVPKLKGKTLAGAKKSLKHAHCGLAKLVRHHSRTVRKGRVISQNHKAGGHFKAGTKIKLTLSRGR